MNRILSIIVLVAVAASLGFAEGPSGRTTLEIQADYLFPNHEAVDAGGLVPVVFGVLGGTPAQPRVAGSTWGGGEFKAIVARSLVVPFLAGQGSMTKDNNLELDLSGELSPVSINGNFRAVLTPIAFLKLEAGAGLGTGWAIGFIGLAMNDAGTIDPQNFGGVIYRAWVAGTFQFDLAALFPGDWNHFVVLASPKIQYQAYSTATKDQAWLWEADQGMNFNGAKLTGSYLVGYQMPIALDLAGLLLQTEGWLGSVRDRSPMATGWGSDFTYLTFGPLFDFKIGDTSSIAILPQFKTGIKWTAASQWNLDFQQRAYQEGYLYFYRLAFDFSLKL